MFGVRYRTRRSTRSTPSAQRSACCFSACFACSALTVVVTASERFLNRQVEAARSLLAEAVVDAKVCARLFVQQDAQAAANAGRVTLEQVVVRGASRDCRRVGEQDVAEQAVARDGVAEFDLAVQQAVAAVPAL